MLKVIRLSSPQKHHLRLGEERVRHKDERSSCTRLVGRHDVRYDVLTLGSRVRSRHSGARLGQNSLNQDHLGRRSRVVQARRYFKHLGADTGSLANLRVEANRVVQGIERDEERRLELDHELDSFLLGFVVVVVGNVDRRDRLEVLASFTGADRLALANLHGIFHGGLVERAEERLHLGSDASNIRQAIGGDLVASKVVDQHIETAFLAGRSADTKRPQ